MSRGIDSLLETWPTAEIAGQAWRDHGWIAIAADDDEAIALADEAANEHLEIQVDEGKLPMYLERLRNYGSLFLGDQATVAYGDKGVGTNRVLPTSRAARYTGGLLDRQVPEDLHVAAAHRGRHPRGRPLDRCDLRCRAHPRARTDRDHAPRARRRVSAWSLDGRVALVTGAGRGLGRGIAIELAAAGAEVLCLARTAADLDAVVAEIRRRRQRPRACLRRPRRGAARRGGSSRRGARRPPRRGDRRRHEPSGRRPQLPDGGLGRVVRGQRPSDVRHLSERRRRAPAPRRHGKRHHHVLADGERRLPGTHSVSRDQARGGGTHQGASRGMGT